MKARFLLALEIALTAGCTQFAAGQSTTPSGTLSPSAPARTASTSPSAHQPAPAASQVGSTGAVNSAAVPLSGPQASPSLQLPQAPAVPPPGTTSSGSLPAPSPADLIGSSLAPGSRAAQAGASITLQEAIHRAQGVDHNYQAAREEQGLAAADKTIARANLLPNVDEHSQAVYTQPQRPYSATRTTSAHDVGPVPIFVANNAVREYITQGVVTETVGLGRITALRLADAQAAVAKARLEVARRGLVTTVVAAYYGLLSAEAKLRIAAVALDEANRFVQVSQELERGGEAAHADVLRAQLQQEQRQRELDDAGLAAERARLDLGVLLFPNPMTPYTLAADLDHPPALPTREALAASAKNTSPDVQAALASVRAAELTVTSSQNAYLPDLSLAYNYGIDADHFAVKEPDGTRNLGYSATATLNIPVWDWFATHAKIRQSELARDLAKADLTVAQRRALAAFQEFYNEADVASRQMASLDRSVADAGEVLRLTDLRYKAGEGTVLEVVDAENTLVTAQQARADGVVRYYTALANLQTITGTMP